MPSNRSYGRLTEADEAAAESAVEAHGEEVPSAEIAWEFINEPFGMGEIERPAALPQFLPRQFHKDYRRNCALLLANAAPVA